MRQKKKKKVMIYIVGKLINMMKNICFIQNTLIIDFISDCGIPVTIYGVNKSKMERDNKKSSSSL